MKIYYNYIRLNLPNCTESILNKYNKFYRITYYFYCCALCVIVTIIAVTTVVDLHNVILINNITIKVEKYYIPTITRYLEL
jgi:hypothetical protein